MTVRLRVLGPINVAIDGANHEARLTQPRLLALLSYLVLARPRGLHSRDTLMALLWPDADQAAGRQGLRNALHRLRNALGEGVIVTAGEGFVGVDHTQVECDALQFEAAIAHKQWTEAVAGYRGEFLQGFHVGGAPEFERWLDHERARLTSAAAGAAWSDAEACRERSDLSGALRSAQLACILTPDDEPSLRRYLQLLDEAGDRPAAIRAYDDFAQTLRIEFGVEPSEATKSDILRIREGRSPNAREQDVSWPEARSPSPRVERRYPVGRRVIVVGSLALCLAFVSAMWLGVLRSRNAMSSATPGGGLPARWRTDTVTLARYLRAQAQLANRELPQARQAFKKLTDDEPLYAPGWAGFAEATYRSFSEDIPPREAMAGARAAAMEALRLDSTLAQALLVMAVYELWGNWDLPATKRRLDAALTLHPADPALNNLLATWHRWRADFDESLTIKRRNASADPLSARHVYQVMPSLYYAHRCEEAAQSHMRLPPEVRQVGEHTLYRSLVCAGRLDDAAQVLRAEMLEEGDSALASELASPPSRDLARRTVFQKRLARELAKRRQVWTPPELVMRYYAELEDPDGTLAWLDSMLVDRSMMIYVVPFDPLMDFLRQDPRFDAFLERLPWMSSLPRERLLVDSLRAKTARPQHAVSRGTKY